MTIKMIALRRFRYPTGPEGREYDEGDEVEILTERDATALRLVRRVKDLPVDEVEPVRWEPPKPEPVKPEPSKPEPEPPQQEKKEENFEHRARRLFGGNNGDRDED